VRIVDFAAVVGCWVKLEVALLVVMILLRFWWVGSVVAGLLKPGVVVWMDQCSSHACCYPDITVARSDASQPVPENAVADPGGEVAVLGVDHCCADSVVVAAAGADGWAIVGVDHCGADSGLAGVVVAAAGTDGWTIVGMCCCGADSGLAESVVAAVVDSDDVPPVTGSPAAEAGS
jgi:hypothetical protein